MSRAGKTIELEWRPITWQVVLSAHLASGHTSIISLRHQLVSRTAFNIFSRQCWAYDLLDLLVFRYSGGSTTSDYRWRATWSLLWQAWTMNTVGNSMFFCPYIGQMRWKASLAKGTTEGFVAWPTNHRGTLTDSCCIAEVRWVHSNVLRLEGLYIR